MTRRALTVTVLALIVATPAHAKGIKTVTACGAHGCVDVTAKATEAAVIIDTTTPTAAPARDHIVLLNVALAEGAQDAGRFNLYVSTDGTKFKADDGTPAWFPVPPDAQPALRDLVDGVAPLYPAEKSGLPAVPIGAVILAIGAAGLYARRRLTA